MVTEQWTGQVSLGPAVRVLSPWRLSGCHDCKTHKNEWGWRSLCLEKIFSFFLLVNTAGGGGLPRSSQQYMLRMDWHNTSYWIHPVTKGGCKVRLRGHQSETEHFGEESVFSNNTHRDACCFQKQGATANPQRNGAEERAHANTLTCQNHRSR